MRHYYYDFGKDYSTKGFVSRYSVISRPNHISIDALMTTIFSKAHADRVLKINSDSTMQWVKHPSLTDAGMMVDTVEASFMVLNAT